MKYYKLADRPRTADLEKLGVTWSKFAGEIDGHKVNWLNPFQVGHIGLVAIFSGEKRPPQAGEWYISGAIPDAYRAPNDLTSSYHIAKLVLVETVTTTRNFSGE